MFVDQLPQLLTYIVDEKKKNRERVYFARKFKFILFIFIYLCDKVCSQWLIYDDLVMLGYKIKTAITMIKKRGCC